MATTAALGLPSPPAYDEDDAVYANEREAFSSLNSKPPSSSSLKRVWQYDETNAFGESDGEGGDACLICKGHERLLLCYGHRDAGTEGGRAERSHAPLCLPR